MVVLMVVLMVMMVVWVGVWVDEGQVGEVDEGGLNHDAIEDQVPRSWTHR